MVIKMESRAIYGNSDAVQIRPETLTHAAIWVQPTPEEVKVLMQKTNLNGGEIAELLGLAPQSSRSGRGSRTARRWAAGDAPIPYAAWALLAYVAGFGPIWEVKE